MSARIEGADQLRDVARRLKAAGDTGKEMRRDLLREIRDVAKGPVVEEFKQAALHRLPARGGLAAYTAKNLKVAARTRLTGTQAGVTIVASIKGMDLPKLEAGKLRHPVYGRGRWVNQSIPADIFGDAVEQVADDVGKAVLKVLDDTAKRI